MDDGYDSDCPAIDAVDEPPTVDKLLPKSRVTQVGDIAAGKRQFPQVPSGIA